MSDQRPGGRKFLTVAVALFAALVLAVLVATTTSYWSADRRPAAPGDVRG